MKEVKAISGTVYGRVQGVGFRYYTVERADALGLTGWVQNLHNGNVEFFAQGSEILLQKLILELERGPGHVEKILPRTVPVDPSLTEFDIRRDHIY